MQLDVQVDVEREGLVRRGHVRAIGLIDGALYRPRRARPRFHRGRHRPARQPWFVRVRAAVRVLFNGDLVVQSAFLAMLFAGLMFNVVGMFLSGFMHRTLQGFGWAIAGVVCLVLATLLLGFFYLDPEPEK